MLELTDNKEADVALALWESEGGLIVDENTTDLATV
jgi:hypothetical protein